jgi:hypothetical protein
VLAELPHGTPTARLTKHIDEHRTKNEALMKEWEELSAAIETNG